MLLSFSGYLDEIESEKIKHYSFFMTLCNVVSGVALPIFKFLFVKSVAGELSELLSVSWPAKPVHIIYDEKYF